MLNGKYQTQNAEYRVGVNEPLEGIFARKKENNQPAKCREYKTHAEHPQTPCPTPKAPPITLIPLPMVGNMLEQ